MLYTEQNYKLSRVILNLKILKIEILLQIIDNQLLIKNN